MAREIPEIVRAAAGLAATVLDEARKLPETLPGLPVRLIGLALQQAMKVQQQYAGFVARGDELFTGLRGEDEPGLATFDDDDDNVELPVTPAGFRESAFDRAGDTEPTSASVDVATAEELGEQVDEAQQSLDVLAKEAPDTEAILDEIAIDELVDQAPTLEETAGAATSDAGSADAEPTAAETLDAEPTADVATPVDDLTAAGDVAPEITKPAPASAAPAVPTSPVTNSSAPRTAAVDGYDSFSVAQLRGRLRGYALTTVQDLLSYEEATRSRAPYLTMLNNRLEKLEEQAVESSPLAPRGA